MGETVNVSITEDNNTISGKFIMTIISGKIIYIYIYIISSIGFVYISFRYIVFYTDLVMFG